MIRAPLDHDMRHYVTDRTSGLRRGYFDEPVPRSRDGVVLWAFVALGIVAIILIATGVIQWT